MGGTCDVGNCDLVDQCCSEIAALYKEAYRSREAQRQADEIALVRLISNSQEQLISEAAQAVHRLQAQGSPGGRRIDIFTGYAPIKSRFLRRTVGRTPLVQERTMWLVPYAQNKRHVLLLCDGLLYDGWRVTHSIVAGNLRVAQLDPITSLSGSKRTGLFVNPRRARIQRHVEQIAQRLRQLGT